MTFPRTFSQEDVQPETDPRAQTPDPVLFPLQQRGIIPEPMSLFHSCFFFSLWFYLLSGDFLPHTALSVCVCSQSPYSPPSHFLPPSPFCYFIPSAGTSHLTAGRGSFAFLFPSFQNFLKVLALASPR